MEGKGKKKRMEGNNSKRRPDNEISTKVRKQKSL